MTNLDLLGSMIAGGILLLSIITFQLYYTDVSRTTVISEVQQSNSTNLAKIVEHEFLKLGYRVPVADKILDLGPDRISFLADLNNDGTVDSVRYSCSVDGDNKKILTRYSSIGQHKTFSGKVDSFALRGLDIHGAATLYPENLSTLQVDLLVTEDTATTQGVEKAGSYWMRRFFPMNMQL